MVGQLRQPTPGKRLQSFLSMNPVSTCIFSSLFFIFFFVLFERISSNVKTLRSADHREEKCDVTLPWQLDFWISPISLDRDGHLHCRTMEEKFCPWVPSSTGNSYMSIFRFFSAIFARNFSTLATWRDDFSLFLSFYIWPDSDAVRRNLILITIGAWKV